MMRDYVSLEKIGKGGMGTVYKACHSLLDRMAVIKQFDMSRDVAGAERFKREARISARMHHANMVNVYDFFEEDGKQFLVMEYVDGLDLREILNFSKRIPPKVAAAIVWTILDALEYAWSFEVIHRDIKPANILISYNGEVKITDFGIAKYTGGDTELTTVGTLIGTPAYMSPEQAAGKEATYLSDIYATGILLYELTTGEKPFAASDTQTLIQQIMQGKYDHPRKINPRLGRRLNHIIKKAMRRDPRDRYRSPGAMKKALTKYLKMDETVVNRQMLVQAFMEDLERARREGGSDGTTTTYLIPGLDTPPKAAVPIRFWLAGLAFSGLLCALVVTLGIFNMKNFKADNLGNIEIATNTPGAILYLDGEEMYRFAKDESHTLINIFRGPHTVTVDAGDYYTRHSAIVFVEPSKQKVLSLPLEAKDKVARLSVWGSRPGAGGTVASTPLKQLPAQWETAPGSVDIDVTLETHQTVSELLDLDIHENRHVLVEMLSSDRDILRIDYARKPELFDLKMKLLALLEKSGLIQRTVTDSRLIETIIPDRTLPVKEKPQKRKKRRKQ